MGAIFTGRISGVRRIRSTRSLPLWTSWRIGGAAAEEYGCPVYASYEELFAHRDEIDLVVNSTFSYQHAAIAADLMRHGFDVVTREAACQARGGRGDADPDRRGDRANDRAVQQSRYAPYFVKIKEILASGVLAECCNIRSRSPALRAAGTGNAPCGTMAAV